MLQQISIVKRMDKTGRVLIPKKLRTFLGITETKRWLLLSIKDSFIYLEPNRPSCLFCNSQNHLEQFEEKFICSSCKEKINAGIDSLKPLTSEEIGFSVDVSAKGRIVIPREIRKTLKINGGDFFNMSVEGNKIKLTHIIGCCSVCGGKIDSEVHNLCKKCLQAIRNKASNSHSA